MRIDFTVPGDPVGKERPRHTKTGHTYTPEKTKKYEYKVQSAYTDCMGGMMDGPVMLDIIAYYQIPQSKSKKEREAMQAGQIRPTKKPDIDNVVKAVADGLNGLAYADDSQIVSVWAEKWYSNDPRVEVSIETAMLPEVGDYDSLNYT